MILKGPKPTAAPAQSAVEPTLVKPVVRSADSADLLGRRSMGRIELPELGTTAMIESYATPGKTAVAIGTTNEEFCVTDPFSSSCGRFKVDPETAYGVTREQIGGWWSAVQMLREEGDYDEIAHQPSDEYIAAYLAGEPLPKK